MLHVPHRGCLGRVLPALSTSKPKLRASARGHAMSRNLLLISLPVAVISTAAIGWPQKPADTPATPENIEAAFKISLAAAAEYEFRVGKDEQEKPLELVREPKLKWSNP